jgi:hypothetical protein
MDGLGSFSVALFVSGARAETFSLFSKKIRFRCNPLVLHSYFFLWAGAFSKSEPGTLVPAKKLFFGAFDYALFQVVLEYRYILSKLLGGLHVQLEEIDLFSGFDFSRIMAGCLHSIPKRTHQDAH